MFNGNNLPQELLLTTRQKIKMRNVFINNISSDIKLSKAQITKIIQCGGFLGSSLSKLAGPLMKVAIALAKNILAPLGKTAALQQLMQRFKQKVHGSRNTTLIFSNEEMNDIMKSVQALEASNILLKGVTKVIKNERKEQKERFLSMLLGALGPSLSGNLLSEKGIVRAGFGSNKEKAIVRAGSGKEWDF